MAWEMNQSLPEFEDRPQEQQHWLIATWRTKVKIKTIEAVEQWQKRKK